MKKLWTFLFFTIWLVTTPLAHSASAPSAMIRGSVDGFNSRYVFIRQGSGEVLRISKKLFPKNIQLRPGQRLKIFVDSTGRGYKIRPENP